MADLNINIVSVYKPPRIRTTRNDWLTIFSRFPSRTILAGDFNAHLRLWGSSHDDWLGNLLIDVLEDQNFVVLNDGSPTRLTKPHQNTSAVDLTLVSSDLVPQASWSVLEENLGSDHFVIQLNLQKKWSPLKIVPSTRWRENRADWPLYQTLISNGLSLPHHMSSNNDEFNALMTTITSAADNSIPIKKTFTPSRKHPVWWDDDCSAVDLRRKEALMQYKRLSNFENYCLFKNQEALARRVFKEKSRKAWLEFINKLNKNSSPHYIWNTMKRLSDKNFNTNQKTIPKTLIDEILGNICPPYVPSMPPLIYINIGGRRQIDLDTQSNIVLEEDEQQEILAAPFNLEELSTSLSVKKNSSPGYDFVTYTLLESLPSEAKLRLLKIYNQ